jgi:hypothetical protein
LLEYVWFVGKIANCHRARFCRQYRRMPAGFTVSADYDSSFLQKSTVPYSRSFYVAWSKLLAKIPTETFAMIQIIPPNPRIDFSELNELVNAKTCSLPRPQTLNKISTPELTHWDKNEIAALEQISLALANAIIETAKVSVGNQFSVKIRPVCGNFGAYAQVRISRRGNALTGQRANEDKESLVATLIAAIQKGRDGCRPQLIPFRLNSSDSKVSGDIHLFVGIRNKTA